MHPEHVAQGGKVAAVAGSDLRWVGGMWGLGLGNSRQKMYWLPSDTPISFSRLSARNSHVVTLGS